MSGVSGGGGGGGGGGGTNRYVWARLGRVWWPGEVVDKRAFTDEMKAAFIPSTKGLLPHAVVKYFEEETFSVIKTDTDMQVHALLDEKKKSDLIKKGIEKTPRHQKDKFKMDVIRMESEVAGRSKELTSVWFDKLLEKKKTEKITSVVKEIFTKPEVKERVRGQIVIAPAVRTPQQQNRSPATTPSGSGSSGRPRFTCPQTGCGFITERMGTLQSHAKCHLASPSSTASPGASGSPVHRRIGTSPLGKRSPRKSLSPVKTHSPSKRGRPSTSGAKKEAKSKMTSGIKKEAILEGWSDAEEDEEDKMAKMEVLGEEPPPTLKLFDTSTSSCVDEKSGELIKQEDGEKATLPGKTVPRTKKELDDVFEELLRQTKPDFDWIDDQGKGSSKIKEEEKMAEEVESSEVSSDEEMRDEVIMRTKTEKNDAKESETGNQEEDKSEVKKDKEDDIENKVENKEEQVEEDMAMEFEDDDATDPEITNEEISPNEIEMNESTATEVEEVDPNVNTDKSEEEVEQVVSASTASGTTSPGPPLLVAEETETIEETPAPQPTAPSPSTLPPTSSEILESPRPPRPTAAVKPTTTSSSPVGMTATGGGGGDNMEDNVEKGSGIVQTTSGSSDGSPPILEPEQIVHLVPVENSDGTLTYMFLSMDQSSQPRLTMEHTEHTAGTLVNGNEMEALYVEKGVDSPAALYTALQQQVPGEEQQFVLLQQGGGAETTSWTLEQLQEILGGTGLQTSSAPGGSTTLSNELGTNSGNE